MVVAAAGERAAFMDAEHVARATTPFSARRTRELKLDDYERIRSDRERRARGRTTNCLGSRRS
jgi:hypothetical protein